MNNFHQKVVNVLTEADDRLYEDRVLTDRLADGIVELCKDEFKVSKTTSDGYHTFGELYDHRMMLFIALLKSYPKLAWRSKLHHKGGEEMFDNMFIAGMNLPSGQISYHTHLEHWDLFEGVKELKRAPEWDGHSPQDVVDRIQAWVATL